MSRKILALRELEEPARDDIIRVRGLTKLSLRALDLTVRSGERVAVIGRTGDGKSVLLKCITGVLRPDAGQIHVLGRRVAGSVRSIEGAGVAFQNSGLFDRMSARSNIELAAGRTLLDDELRRWFEALDLFIDPDASLARLSGGQVKRVALLRAVIRGDRLVILDEPTSGLDPATSERVATALSSVLVDDNRAMLLVTHDYETAARLCTRFHLLTPAGSLEELDIPVLMSNVDKAARLREALSRRGEETGSVDRQPPPPASVTSMTVRLLADSVPIALAAMALLGALLVRQSSGISPIDISQHVPGIVIWAVFREIAPLVVGLLLAGRVAARIAAETGGMSYTAQIASMRVLGLSPSKELYVPFVVSAAVAFPVCIVAGACAAVIAGALLTATPFCHLSIGAYRFMSLAEDAFSPKLIVSCAVKGLLMALAVTGVAYRVGVAQIDTAQAVGSAVTKAVIIGSASIVATDVAVSLMLF